MASARNETRFASKGEEARIEAHQIAFVLGDRAREIVEPEFASAAPELLESVQVAADKSFETLIVSKPRYILRLWLSTRQRA